MKKTISLGNLRKGLNKTGRIIAAPRPEKIKRLNFAITYRCNSKCRACSIWKTYQNKSVQSEQELTLEQIKELCSRNKYFKSIDEINLTGGEPFLREGFGDIFRYFRTRFPHATIIITTNGLRVKKDWLNGKKDIGQTIIIFSLDGLEETNDYIRGIKGSYSQVIKSVNNYKKLYPSLRMGLSFTILPENYLELKKVYELSRKLDISFTMRFGSSSETYYDNSQISFSWTEEMLKRVESDVKSVLTHISSSRNILNRLLNPDLYFYSKMVYYQRENKRLFQCYSGIHSLFLDPYGNVYPCIFTRNPIGNIKKQSFEDLWFSEKAGLQRKFIETGKCHCWTECETIPSLQRKLWYKT